MEHDLTVAEVAERTRLSVQTVRLAIKNGRLQAHRVGERRLYIRQEDFLDWLARGAPNAPLLEAEA